MKAAFALLADHQVHNLVRELSWEIHQRYKTGTRHASLPPHVSLKQPFAIADLSALENYMAELADSLQPLELTLTELQVIPVSSAGTAYGLLWIDVEETPEIRNLHNRLNAELNQRFGHSPADYDGEQYHFHMTVMMGGQPVEVYRKFYSELPDPRINVRFTARELAMFVYEEPLGPGSEYLCYRILPLGR